MAARVQVVIETKETGSGVLRALAAQFGALGNLVEDLTTSNINWGQIAQTATMLVVDAFKKAYDVATKYASSVRDIALVSGTTAEEASRLIQVLDDFEIQTEDILTATRRMTQNGLAPTIDTIAQLSDQYNKLNSVEEKNAFIQDNLGRGGSKWANVLKEGSTNILALNSSVSQSLILNDRQIQQYEEMRLNVDAYNDNVMALQVNFINQVVPTLNAVIEKNNDLTRAIEILNEAGDVSAANQLRMGNIHLDTSEKALAQAVSEREAAAAIKEAGAAAQEASVGYAANLTMLEKLNGATREQIKLAAYQDLKSKLTESGGKLTEEEAQVLQDAGLALGVFDKFAVGATNSIEALNAKMIAGIITTKQYAAALNSIPTSIDVQIHQTTVNSTQGSILAGNAASGSANASPALGTQGWNTVPAGYPNEGYMVRMSSGEKYNVQNSAQQSMSDNESQASGMSLNNFYGNVTLVLPGDGQTDIAGIRI